MSRAAKKQEPKKPEAKSGSIAIFETDLLLLQAEFEKQKTTAEEKGIAAFGKQKFLGRCLIEVLPYIQEVIFNGKKLTVTDKDN